MSQQDTSSRLTPRSAVRYRPLPNQDTDVPEMLPVTPLVRRASRLRQPDQDETVEEWKRVAGDPVPSAPSPRTEHPVSSKQPFKAHQPGKRTGLPQRRSGIHPLLYLSLGMLVTLATLAVLSVVTSWFVTTLDDLHYGRPRTFQIDAYVGHNESAGVPSHFIALNLRGHLEIIEFPGGDATHARIYLGPQLYGPDADVVPVTLSFTDVNGDHRPDMVLHFQGNQVIFINEAGKFRPARPQEQR